MDFSLVSLSLVLESQLIFSGSLRGISTRSSKGFQTRLMIATKEHYNPNRYRFKQPLRF